MSEVAAFAPNQFRRASDVTEPRTFRDGRWKTFEPQPPVARLLGGRVWFLRPGLTFTPYANPVACNAHCAFCSEELLRHDADRLTAKTLIADHPAWLAALDRVWSDLQGFPMGLSLSGLEATAHPAWFLGLLDVVEKHTELLPEKVLYTNGSGLCDDARLIDALVRVRFDRVELSRAHFDEDKNQSIMRFRRDVAVWRGSAFDRLVRDLGARVPVKLSCILNRQGVATIDDVEDHVRRAAALGVGRVVFRELSALGDLYRENREHRWIEENRVDVRELMDVVMPTKGGARRGWELTGVTSGYYYYNEVYRFAGVDVVLEASSYVAHKDVIDTRVLQKLVFHSTGDLCGDWVPNSLVVGNWLRA